MCVCFLSHFLMWLFIFPKILTQIP
jgi:hypothetical protein